MSPPLPLSSILLRSPFIALLALLLFALLPVQSRPLDYPLPHPNLGCPTIHFWADQNNEVDGCHQIFHASSDNKWISEDQTRVVTWEEDRYFCCDSNNGCISGAEYATCVYADNYCPTVVVRLADGGNEECVGTYNQYNNVTWKNEVDDSTNLVITGRNSDGSLVFGCEKEGIQLGYIVTYHSYNSYMPTTLEYGLNKLPEGSWLNVVGEEYLIDSFLKKAFQVTTPADPSEWMTVWVLTRAPVSVLPSVVIPQLFYDNPRMAVVELSDIDKVTFRMRVVHSPNCIENKVAQHVSILIMPSGTHRGTGANKYAIAAKLEISGGRSETCAKVYNEGTFRDPPSTFVHIQQILNEECGNFMQVKVTFRTLTDMCLRLETTISPAPENCRASVGFIGIMADDNQMPHYQWKEGEGYWLYHYATNPSVKELSDELHTLHFRDPRSINPIVFVQTQSNHETDATGEITALRLHSSSSHHAHFSMIKDRCDSPQEFDYGPDNYEFYTLLAIFRDQPINYISSPTNLSPRGLMNQHLPHPSLGCPLLQFWANGKENDIECLGLFYRDVDVSADFRWSNRKGGPRRYVTWEDDKYYCCEPDFYDSHDRSCKDSPITVPSAESATCVYADNYCPTLEVTTVTGPTAITNFADDGSTRDLGINPKVCEGIYAQYNNSTWIYGHDNAIKLLVKGRGDNGALWLACERDGILMAYVVTYDCDNTLIPKPLEYGLSRMADGSWLNVVGGDYLIDGSFFSAFQVTTPENAYEWMTVWVQTRSMEESKPMVVIPQLFYDYPQTASVELADVGTFSFRMRIVHSPNCNKNHKKDRINILMMAAGEHRGSEGDVAVSELYPTAHFPLLDIPYPHYFPVEFPSIPLVFAHIQQIVGGDGGFLQARTSVESTSTYMLLYDPSPTNRELLVVTGYIAFSVQRGLSSLFGGRYVIPYQDLDGDLLSDSLRTQYFGDVEDYDPIVIVQTATLNHQVEIDDSNQFRNITTLRLHSSSAYYNTFTLNHDTCEKRADDFEYAREGYAIFALYRKTYLGWTPPTTTTSTTITSTTSTIAPPSVSMTTITAQGAPMGVIIGAVAVMAVAGMAA